MWSSDKQLPLHKETCQKCRAPGPTLDAQNKNLHETVPRWSAGPIPFEKPCFGRTYEISPVGPSCALCGVLWDTVYTSVSSLGYGLQEGKTSSLWSLYFQSFSLSLAHAVAQQMFTCSDSADLQVSLELRSRIPDEMSFCTDRWSFHFWMLLFLAELMLLLPPFSAFTDGLECLLADSGSLPSVDCWGPGSWASLLVTSQALLIEASFRDRTFAFPSRMGLIWLQMCVRTWWGGAPCLSGCYLSPHTPRFKLLLPFPIQTL